MPDISDLFPSKYLRGVDLKAPVTVTITGVRSERMYKPDQAALHAIVGREQDF